jgi:precorrin-8X/cobalt-precorrin-8 methylmutase
MVYRTRRKKKVSRLDYLKDPKAIYDQSFAIIADELDLPRFALDEHALLIRLIHACGMVDIVDDLVISPGAVEAGQAAMAEGAPIICDVNMVAKGIITRMLPANNQVLCGLDLPAASAFALANNHTRTAGGIQAMGQKIKGAIIAIGNAPTALFHLLEMIGQGAPKPALILGFPVGFVGAAESKAQLIAQEYDVPFVALKGRRGGSAFAAAAVNALGAGLRT